MNKKINVGSRQSRLAMAQTKIVVKKLKQLFPDFDFGIKKIVTQGDRDRKTSLAKIGGKGVFVKAIEKELQDKTIDLAVHSLKDVSPVLPADLELGAFPKRQSPFDCLVSVEKYSSLYDLPKGARLGTNSVRRQGQILHLRPDVKIVPIRGNIDTRLKKINSEHLNGVILAVSGLKRLRADLSAYHVLNLKDALLPAVGQGCLAIECRKGDQKIQKILKKINDPQSAACVQVERDFMRELGGSCNFPIAGFARYVHKQLVFDGLIASPDGKHVLAEKEVSGDKASLGKAVADHLLAKDRFGIIKGEK